MNRAHAYSQRCACIAASLLLMGAPCVGFSQTVASTISTLSPPDYHPSMGDLMTMTVQPRHIKLGLAGKQENWIYAKYELSELRNAFGRIARAIPKYQSIDTAALTTAIMQAALNTLEKSIDANSAAQFTEAYTQLTEACNACHLNRNHAAVAIKVPDATMFPDQEFLPSKR
jgi:DNA repair ATPase RecN